jgi:hypothetical protein
MISLSGRRNRPRYSAPLAEGKLGGIIPVMAVIGDFRIFCVPRITESWCKKYLKKGFEKGRGVLRSDSVFWLI